MSYSEIVDLTELGSQDSSVYSDGASDDVFIIDAKPPDKKPRLDEICSNWSDDSDLYLKSLVAPTSAYTNVAGIPSMLMVLTEGRGFASEIAYCIFNTETSQCTVSQFADSASYSRTIYAIVTARPQIVFVPKAMAEGKSKAMLNIRRYLPWLTVVPFERKRFSDANGVQVLQTIALPCQVVQLTRVLHTKQYAYAALNAMFSYLEHDQGVIVSSGSVNITYRQMEDLGLEDCGDSNDKRERSLFGSINHTKTKMGGRLLRSNILQPSTDLSTIYARQTAVLEILDHEKLFFFLSAQLVEIPDIDATITSLIRLSAVSTSRQVSQAINNVLSVKHVLQAAERLASGFKEQPQCALLSSILDVLTESRVGDLLSQIHSVIREDITMEKSAQMTRSQRCHAVKDGVDGFLDVSRVIFDKVTQEVVSLVKQYSDEIQVPIRAVYKPSIGYIMTAKRSDLGSSIPEEFVNVTLKKQAVSFTTLDLIKLNNRLSSVVIEINLLTEKAIQNVAEVIRENITVLYRVSEAIGLVDMVVSFAHYCTLHSCVVPEFSDTINVVQGRHPVLEAIGREVVSNNVNTTSATFTIVSGPNMGGKSTYLRQIIYMVIMAQIGSLVPAQSATLKVFDKLFVRMNNNDNMAASESTFLREMHDVAYILQNYDQHSLLLIDELGRSTATVEGKAICQAICEELVESPATTFLTTHFLELPDVLGVHPNCSQIILSASTDEGYEGQRFKATFGAQAETMYGIRLAQRMGFPSDVIAIAEQVKAKRDSV
ncbi:MutS protein msh4 [Coemansia sp. RSA 2711]|nr:MutS protein msh4 [Coemansia sp. RSA 2711]